MVIVLGCVFTQLGVPVVATLTMVITVSAVTTISVSIGPDVGIVIV